MIISEGATAGIIIILLPSAAASAAAGASFVLVAADAAAWPRKAAAACPSALFPPPSAPRRVRDARSSAEPPAPQSAMLDSRRHESGIAVVVRAAYRVAICVRELSLRQALQQAIYCAYQNPVKRADSNVRSSTYRPSGGPCTSMVDEWRRKKPRREKRSAKALKRDAHGS